MIKLNKTFIMPKFDSGTYKGMFEINNEYLTDYWFDCKHNIWDKISVQIAVLIEKEIKEQMKTKMNPESYNELFANQKQTAEVKR